MRIGVAPLRLTRASRVSVGTSEVNPSSQSCHGVVVKAVCTGSDIVYVDKFVAGSATTAATAFPLANGEVIDLAVKNLNELAFIASGPGQAVALLPYSYY